MTQLPNKDSIGFFNNRPRLGQLLLDEQRSYERFKDANTLVDKSFELGILCSISFLRRDYERITHTPINEPARYDAALREWQSIWHQFAVQGVINPDNINQLRP